MWPVTLTYFCYGWCLWLYLNWLPLFFKNNYGLDIKNSALFASGVFFAGVVGDSLGGILSDRHPQAHRQVFALPGLSVIIVGFAGALALAASDPVHPRHHDRGALPVGGFLLCGARHRSDLVRADGHRAEIFRHGRRALMNSGSALAAIVSPLVAGFVIDATGNWYLPFLMSMGLLALGGFSALLMHPELPFDEIENSVPVGKAVAAE